MDRIEHEEVKKKIGDHAIDGINRTRDINYLLDHICGQGPVIACAIIDRLIPLISAFVLMGFELRSRDGNENAKAILDRAYALEIRGTKGLCHARDEFFEQTGVFLC